ncbi:hypothetical protein D0T50_11770 [Bacteroides sp. 214]|nr:hypothetical protein [Bacteroides sp. 214]
MKEILGFANSKVLRGRNPRIFQCKSSSRKKSQNFLTQKFFAEEIPGFSNAKVLRGRNPRIF